MARTRYIKPGFFFNTTLAKLDMSVRLLFIALWTIADRAGRLKDDPLRIKAETLPYDNVDIDVALEELCRAGFVKRYEVKGCKYIQIVNWEKHQFPHHKEKESLIPAPGKTRTRLGKDSDKTYHDPPSVPLMDNGEWIMGNGEPKPESPPSPKHSAGWEPTEQSTNDTMTLLHRLEKMFGVWPITSKQMGNGEAEIIKSELAAILRLLSVDEAAEVVKRRMEEREKETKGADRPVNIKWYMVAIKDAFYTKDRTQEQAERRRDEEKKRRPRDNPSEPVPIGKVLEKELSPEERKAKFAEVKKKIAGGKYALEAKRQAGNNQVREGRGGQR